MTTVPETPAQVSGDMFPSTRRVRSHADSVFNVEFEAANLKESADSVCS